MQCWPRVHFRLNGPGNGKDKRSRELLKEGIVSEGSRDKHQVVDVGRIAAVLTRVLEDAWVPVGHQRSPTCPEIRSRCEIALKVAG